MDQEISNIPRSVVHRLIEQAERLRDRPALWSKRDGAYVPISWREYAIRVKRFALGLISLGFEPGQRLAIMGFSREEWVVADLGAMAAGGVPVGLYTTTSAEQLAYLVGHCEAPIALVENRTYLERLQSVRPQLPALKTVVVMDPEGVTLGPEVLSYAELLARGERVEHHGGDATYQARLEGLRGDQLATLIYTSGTTGHPKGVMLSHHNLTWTAAQLSTCADLGEDELMLSYLPLSHIAEQVCTIHAPVLNGIQIHFAESFEQVPDNLREVRPTVFFGVPRVWEKFKARAEAGMEALPARRQRLVGWARQVALDFHTAQLGHRQPSLGQQAQYRLAQRLVFQALKARIGFDRCRIFATSAAPIGRDVLDFFASVDIVLREVYGQSEVTGPTSVNTLEHTRLGTLGQPMPGVTVKIADDGEILVKGDNLCQGYFKDPVATGELLQHGWLHSGDLGELDREGFLTITGRKKEIIVTSGGKKTAPATIEAYLRALEPIGHALVVGDRRNYLVALLTLDPEKVGAFAKKHALPGEAAALASDPAFRASLLARIEAEVNSRLSRFEQIKKVEVLPADFTVETQELTSTLKMRRAFCEQKFQAQIERLYA